MNMLVMLARTKMVAAFHLSHKKHSKTLIAKYIFNYKTFLEKLQFRKIVNTCNRPQICDVS